MLRREGEIANASNYAEVRGVLRGLSDLVQIYVDEENLKAVPDALILDAVRRFETIQGEVETLLGPCSDADHNGRFTLVFSERLNRLGRADGGLEGLFRSTDLDASVPLPFGNQGDVIFLNPRLEPGPRLAALIAHEYAHAVIASAKLKRLGAGAHEENWLDEAIAHVVEEKISGNRSNIDYRVHAFLDRPEAFSLVIPDYYRSGLFRSHGHRGCAYLFLRWCVDRRGEALLGSLARSGRTGVSNLEHATGMPFPDLYREWTHDLARAGFSPALAPPEATSMDTYGVFGRYQLAGVRSEVLDQVQADREWVSPGTSTRFFLVDRPLDSPSFQIEVHSTIDSGLVVSWIPWPEDLPRLGLSVPPEIRQGSSAEVLASVVGRPQGSLDIKFAGWSSRRLDGEPIDRAETDWMEEQATCGENKGRRTTVRPGRPLRLEVDESAAGPTPLFRVIGADERGRRVSAWLEFPRN